LDTRATYHGLLIRYSPVYLSCGQKHKYDLYIGVGTWFQVFTGLFLKRIGFVKRIIFWTTDYSPVRFRNPILKRMYAMFDKFCVERTDYAWSPTYRIVEDRVEKGYGFDPKKQIVVPYGIEPCEIEHVPSKLLLPYSLVYLGVLRENCGFELLLEALPLVIKKIPAVKVTVITYESFPIKWLKWIDDHNLKSNFEILGYISDNRELGKILKLRKVGLVLYERSFKTFSDPARPKTFLSKGLPLVITNVPLIANEISQNEAGVVIRYDKDELSQAILKLLEDNRFYLKCRENAVKLSAEYDIEKIFDHAFEQM
jgi:glycosyltransferase involved in cell wall biosynthesis